MMKTLIKRVLYSLLLFFGVLLNAQTPPPPTEETGDIGGIISQPVDMYILALAVVAVMFIVYYARQNSKKLA